MAKAKRKLPFEVRESIEEADLDSEEIQGVYDAINRMVVLIGKIPFKDLFRTPVSKLAGKVGPRVRDAAELGLLKEPAIVEALIRELATREKAATIGDFFVKSRDQINPETHIVLRKLRRHGLRLPLPIHDRRKQKARQAALNKFVTQAGEWTFLDLFTKSADKMPRAFQSALRNVRLLGLLGWWNNDRCCDVGGGGGGIKDACVVNTGTFCSISQSPVTRGLCTAASDICPGDRPGRPG